MRKCKWWEKTEDGCDNEALVEVYRGATREEEVDLVYRFVCEECAREALRDGWELTDQAGWALDADDELMSVASDE